MTSGGDFLSGFSGGNTQKPLTGKNTEAPVKDEKPTEPEWNKKVSDTEKPAVNVAENKKLADKIVAEAEKAEKTDAKPKSTPSKPVSTTVATRPAQSANSVIKAPEHVVTTDKSYNKRTIIKYGVIGTVIIALALVAFLIFRMMNTREVPNFVGRELRDAELWQIQGGATIASSEEYNLEHAAGIIIWQSVEPGETISRSSVLNVTVSRGPNMNEVVDLPDFMTMTRGQITTWVNENRMRSVTFTNEASAEVEQNRVIRVEFPPAVDPDNFRRSDSVTIFVSTGAATVQLPDFVGDELEEVLEFIADNPGIELVIEEEENENIAAGVILRQSPARGTRVSDGETLTIIISQGDPIIVPNFANIRRIDATTAVDGLSVDVEERFHATVPMGRFISQSVPAGTRLFRGHDEVRVIYSLGRPWIRNLQGSLEIDIEEMIRDFNEQGAPITREVRYIDHWEPRGTVVEQSIYNQFAALNANIIFSVSRGNRERPVDPEFPDIPADIWSVECGPGVETSGIISFPLFVTRNGQLISESHNSWTALSTNRPASWISSLNFSGLSINRSVVNHTNIRVSLLLGGREEAFAVCMIPSPPGTQIPDDGYDD